MTRSQRHMRYIHGYDSGEYPPWWGPVNEPPQVPPYFPPDVPPVEQGLSISTIVPDECLMSDPPLTVTLTGTGFTPQCVVEAGANQLNPNFISPTQLSWEVDPQQANAPGDISLHVKNQDGVVSNDVTFTFVDPNPPEIYPRELRIDAIDPVNCKLSDPPFTATLTGVGFIDGCMIRAHTEDGTDTSFQPTFVNETTLSWGVNPSTVADPLTVWFHVQNPNTNESNDMVFEFLPADAPAP